MNNSRGENNHARRLLHRRSGGALTVINACIAAVTLWYRSVKVAIRTTIKMVTRPVKLSTPCGFEK
jgi:hypothetical protein